MDLYLTTQQKKDVPANTIYMQPMYKNVIGSATPMLSTAKLKAADLGLPKDNAVEHHKVGKENIIVRTDVQRDMELARVSTAAKIFPIIAVDIGDNNIAIVANVRDDVHSNMHRNVGDSESINVSINKSVEYVRCDFDKNVFPNGVKDLLVMFDL